MVITKALAKYLSAPKEGFNERSLHKECVFGAHTVCNFRVAA